MCCRQFCGLLVVEYITVKGYLPRYIREAAPPPCWDSIHILKFHIRPINPYLQYYPREGDTIISLDHRDVCHRPSPSPIFAEPLRHGACSQRGTSGKSLGQAGIDVDVRLDEYMYLALVLLTKRKPMYICAAAFDLPTSIPSPRTTSHSFFFNEHRFSVDGATQRDDIGISGPGLIEHHHIQGEPDRTLE